MSEKTVKIVFVITLSNFQFFWHKDGQDDNVRCTNFSSHSIYVNTLTCEVQILQADTLHCSYLYHIAHFYVISSTEGAT